MTGMSVVIDAVTRAKLLAAGNGGVEVKDEAGEVIGRFYPSAPSGPPTPPPGYAIEGEWLSDEEIDRSLREDRCYSVAEMDAFLEGLKRATSGR
jgi:adenine deaminase